MSESLLQTTQIALSGDLIDFGVGQPDFSLLPLELLRKAAAQRLGVSERGLLQYGLEQGDGYFRQALAAFLTHGYGMPVSSEQLFVSNGISQALDLICTLFARPGDVVVVEEPSYFLALRIFADHHLRVISLPVDGNGLSIDALEELLERESPALLYTVPSFQNPTGITLPFERRQRLVELSQRHGFYLVADEVYQLLGYTADPPRPMAGFIESETVLSLGSFSKVLAPGLRLGWVQAAPAVVQRLAGCGLLESGGGLNPFTSAIVRSVLEQGWQQEHLAYLQQVYGSRAKRLSHALRRRLGDMASFTEPQGGFFIWLKLAAALDTSELLELARPQGVGFQPGIKFSSRGGLTRYMRLCFAFYDEDTLEEGAALLAGALEAAAPQ